MLDKVPDEMREAFQQMHMALRKTTLPLSRHGGEREMARADASEADKVQPRLYIQAFPSHSIQPAVLFHFHACRSMFPLSRHFRIPRGFPQVVEWRRAHGKPEKIDFHSCLCNAQLGQSQSCKYVRVGEALICERSGWAHLCDDT